MAKYKLVVFDMAGTTVKDSGNVADSFLAAFRQKGIEIPAEEAQKVMGWRKIDAIRMLLQKLAPERAEEAGVEALIESIHDNFINNMIAFYASDTDLQPLPHAEALFQSLRNQGIHVALNTGFTRAITDTILQRLHWHDGAGPDAVICSDEVPEGRPHPHMINALMKRFGIEGADKVVKVGDTEVDVQEGRNAGCGLVLAITTGAYSRSQLEMAKPDYIINSLHEIPALLV
jgi:phosphonatase-like hydrolase